MVGKTTLTGAAGEHLVMSRLLSRGFIAALAPQGVPNLDIIVTSVDGQRLCNIQVKTRWQKGSDGGWHMGKKHENIVEEHLYYCFVDLGQNPEANAVVYVLPSKIVARVVRDSHAAWLLKPGKNGKQHENSDFRRFLPNHEKDLGVVSEFGSNWLTQYRENWALLPLTSDDATAR